MVASGETINVSWHLGKDLRFSSDLVIITAYYLGYVDGFGQSLSRDVEIPLNALKFSILMYFHDVCLLKKFLSHIRGADFSTASERWLLG